jgi:hypothetical protein
LHDLQERLPGAEAARDLLPDGTRLDRIDKLFHHRQRDVGLEERHAHLAQRALDVVLRQARLAADTAQALGEAIGQVLEHGNTALFSASSHDIAADDGAEQARSGGLTPLQPAGEQVAVANAGANR